MKKSMLRALSLAAVACALLAAPALGADDASPSTSRSATA